MTDSTKPKLKNKQFHEMKNQTIICCAALCALLASCAKKGAENYDVSNPYAAPDAAAGAGADTPASNVNPAYEAPAAPSYQAPAAYEEPATAATPKRVPAGNNAAGMKVHTVVSGDSLWAIGKKYSVSVDSIKQANNLTKDTAVLGAKLKIPAL